MALFGDLGRTIERGFREIKNEVGDFYETLFKPEKLIKETKRGLSDVNKVISTVTPWNDSTTFGRILTTTVLAAAAYYGANALLGAGAETTAGATATGGSSVAEATGYSLGAKDALAGVGSSYVPATTASATASTAPAYSLIGEGGSAGLLGSSQLAGSMATSATSGAIANAPYTSGNLSTALGHSTTQIPSTVGASSGNGLLTWAEKHPFLASGAVIGGAQMLGGALNYLGAQEQSKAVEKMQNQQLEKRYSYGGSFGSRVSGGGSSRYGFKRDASEDNFISADEINNMIMKLKTDPEYRRGFQTVAAKLIAPDEAQEILKYTRPVADRVGVLDIFANFNKPVRKSI